MHDQLKGSPMIAYLENVDSPAGAVTFAVNEAGALVRLRFHEGAYPRAIEEQLGSRWL